MPWGFRNTRGGLPGLRWRPARADGRAAAQAPAAFGGGAKKAYQPNYFTNINPLVKKDDFLLEEMISDIKGNRACSFQSGIPYRLDKFIFPREIELNFLFADIGGSFRLFPFKLPLITMDVSPSTSEISQLSPRFFLLKFLLSLEDNFSPPHTLLFKMGSNFKN